MAMLSIPYIFYDTEPLEAGRIHAGQNVNFFQKPIGHRNIRNEVKLEDQTNLAMCTRLSDPLDFEVHGIEMCFPWAHEIVSRINIQSHSRIVFTPGMGQEGEMFVPADSKMMCLRTPRHIGRHDNWRLQLCLISRCFVKPDHEFILYGRTYVQMRLLGILHYPKGWYDAHLDNLAEWLGYVPKAYASGRDMQED